MVDLWSIHILNPRVHHDSLDKAPFPIFSSLFYPVTKWVCGLVIYLSCPIFQTDSLSSMEKWAKCQRLTEKSASLQPRMGLGVSSGTVNMERGCVEGAGLSTKTGPTCIRMGLRVAVERE